MPLKDAKEATLFKRLKAIAAKCTARGFKVVQTHGDNQFTCLADRLLDIGIVFHAVAANTHEPFIKRDNRTSKERCCCIVDALPFKKIPRRMVMELPALADFCRNYWYSSAGVSKTTTPGQMITGMQLDVKKHRCFECGEHIVAHVETGNTMKLQGEDGIFLRLTGTTDGSFWAPSPVIGK